MRSGTRHPDHKPSNAKEVAHIVGRGLPWSIQPGRLFIFHSKRLQFHARWTRPRTACFPSSCFSCVSSLWHCLSSRCWSASIAPRLAGQRFTYHDCNEHGPLQNHILYHFYFYESLSLNFHNHSKKTEQMNFILHVSRIKNMLVKLAAKLESCVMKYKFSFV